MPRTVLALDIGGTKLAAGIVDEAGRVLSRARRPTPREPDGEVVYAALREAVREAVGGTEATPEAVGVGSGGPMRMYEGTISPLNIPGWRHEFPLTSRLEQDLGLPVTLDNDAKAFALGEHLFGAGRDHLHMMGVVVSTGVGSGLVSGGSLIHGRTGNAGHVGHVVAEPDGPRCPCGGWGCVEAIASGPSMARLVGAQLEAGRESSLTHVTEPITARHVAEAARGGDALAREAFERAGRALGVGFSGAAALLDFDLVVVGGGVSEAGDLLFPPLRETIARHARLDYLPDLRVVPAENGADAGIVGAAALVISG